MKKNNGFTVHLREHYWWYSIYITWRSFLHV